MNVSNGHAAEPNKHWANMLHAVLDDRPGFDGISRHNHRQIWDHACPGEIFYRVMGRSKLAVCNAAGHPTESHIVVGVSQVRFDLLQCSSCQKTGRATNERELSPVR